MDSGLSLRHLRDSSEEDFRPLIRGIVPPWIPVLSIDRHEPRRTSSVDTEDRIRSALVRLDRRSSSSATVCFNGQGGCLYGVNGFFFGEQGAISAFFMHSCCISTR